MEELQSRGYATRSNLAFEFGVSIRTIDNDLLHLPDDCPIYTVKGKGGGIYLPKEYRRDRRAQYLTDKQRTVLERLAKGMDGEDKSVLESILAVFARPNKQEQQK